MGKFSLVTKKLLKDRLRFLSDKIQDTYNDMKPRILEFEELKKEYSEILIELQDRGIIGERQESSREVDT